MKSYRPMTPKETRQFIQDACIAVVCALGIVLSLMIVFGKYLAA